MQAYTEILPPTAVSHAICLPLLDSKTPTLVVAKTSLLQLFQIKLSKEPLASQQGGSANGTTPNSPPQTSSEPRRRLSLLAEYPLLGTITSLAGIKTLNTRTGGDALLISFKNAKISLVEWDPEIFNLSTVSIHFYEGEDSRGVPWDADISNYSSCLIVDPGNRCAALKFGQGSLAILPFHQLGDDLVMDDYDPDLDEAKIQNKANAVANQKSESNQKPYSASFVLPLKALDSGLSHLVDLAFLHEYREPTLGVLSSSQGGAYALQYQRKDILNYTVFTLDIEQRARTPLLSVPGLPSDLSKIIPLPLPIGGTLLIGGNEIVHVDQAGKTHAVGVNEFSRQCSSFSMHDQSNLALRLEGCIVQSVGLSSGDLLLILQSGNFAILSFRMDGRSIAGLAVRNVSLDNGGNILKSPASCAALIGRDLVFIGGLEGDSHLIECKQNRPTFTRKRSRAEMIGHEVHTSDEGSDDEDDDDLYGENATLSRQMSSTSLSGSLSQLKFVINDTLKNLAVLGQPIARRRAHIDSTSSEPAFEILFPSGSQNKASLDILTNCPCAMESKKLNQENVKDIWTISIALENPEKKSSNSNEKQEFEDRVIVSCSKNGSSEVSRIYKRHQEGLREIHGTEYALDTETLDIGTLGNGTKVVHVSKDELHCYDQALSLSQIIPMTDDTTDEDLKILHTSFCDPYLLVIRDNFSAVVFQIDEKGEIDELDAPETFNSINWTAGSIYQHKKDELDVYLYLLDKDGTLQTFVLPDLSKPVYTAKSLNSLPSTISPHFVPRRSTPQVKILEILAADLGNFSDTSMYLIFLTEENEVVMYQPFHYPSRKAGNPFVQGLKWARVPLRNAAGLSTMRDVLQEEDEQTHICLRKLKDINGHCGIFISLSSPSMILKESISLPTFYEVSFKCMATLDLQSHNKLQSTELVMMDSKGTLSLGNFPRDTSFALSGWLVRSINFKQEIDALCYYPPTNHYIIGTSRFVEFNLPEDDYHHEWAREETSFNPSVSQGALKLLNPFNYEVLDEVGLEADETVLCMETVLLEVSETTRERKPLLAVGTAIVKGEDLAAAGSIYIFEVIDVVPEPGYPQTGKKLKQLTREVVKGAVTALCEVSSHGFLLVAQGQKCMVRGLKEDNSLLPVAFMDMQCYVSVLKNLQDTAMALMGDAIKGLWFSGFGDEPYKLVLFGKSQGDLPIVAAEFLPYHKQLYFLIADDEQNLNVLEYNPDDPNSLSGQRLVHRSTFHCGHATTSMTLISSLQSSHYLTNGDIAHAEETNGHVNRHEYTESRTFESGQILLTTSTGVLALVTPVSESAYRRLSVLQTYLINNLEHVCGLNPRAYRAVHDAEGLASKGVLDGGLLCRWPELNTQRRTELWGRLGSEKNDMLQDLDNLRGAHLASNI